MGIRLIKFQGTKGIVKCNHVEKDRTIELLRSLQRVASHEVKVATRATSGTIRALLKSIE